MLMLIIAIIISILLSLLIFLVVLLILLRVLILAQQMISYCVFLYVVGAQKIFIKSMF